MKKNVPFKKEIAFKTNLSEITSISLEHTLHAGGEKENLISGEFIVSGEYKIADSSTNTEQFLFELPFDIQLDENYILDHAIVDIEDFYYEIINNHILVVNIEVGIDKLAERPVLEEHKKTITQLPQEEKVEEKEEVLELTRETKEEDCMEEVEPIPSVVEEKVVPVSTEEKRVTTKEFESLFDNLDDSSETYSTYHVYIVRDGDTLEGIIQKYNVTREQIEPYNDLQELKLGDKLIIPDCGLAKN